MARIVISSVLDHLLLKNEKIIVAIDGNCASGKSTIASDISNSYDCNIFHTDDFFLRPEQRTPERYNTPGGNVDYERFKEEVLDKIHLSNSFEYRRFDCKEMKLGESIRVNGKRLNIVEGVYSMHPDLTSMYDYKILMSIDKNLQMDRIVFRNGKKFASIFETKWIPLENRYFFDLNIWDQADLVLRINR